MTSDYKRIAQITATNVALRDQYIMVGDETIRLPQPAELVAYLTKVRDTYRRWADLPDDADEPLFDPAVLPDEGPDDYIQVDAKPLPMRVAEFRDQPTNQEPDAKELLDAVGDVKHTVILGEPGSGKTTALERLAWVTANGSIERAANGDDTQLVVPIFARLADFQGESDLLPMLRRVLSRNGISLASNMTVRATLQATDAHFVLLLDGLNELSRTHREQGLGAVHRHMDEFFKHTVHLTCRTADFDQAQAEAQLPDDTQLWHVQPLVDRIRYWDDEEGESDVREYLRRHLGEKRARRLYEHLQTDERLHSVAGLPLFLFMFKETAGSDKGELPANRGELIKKFLRSDRIMHHVPQHLRTRALRSLGAIAWKMQQNGSLELEEDALLDLLDTVRGRRSYELDNMRRYLQETGLLVRLEDERYRLLHQLVQEYGAAAYLADLDDCGDRLPVLAQEEWWRETCILSLWLRKNLQTPDYLFSIMGDPQIDLRVRFAAGEVLGEVGDPRFVRKAYTDGVEAIEPEMVLIPAGEAILGGEDPEAYEWEKPECRIWVDAFELGVFPVTNEEYACFVKAGGYEDESLWTEQGRAWLRGESKLDEISEQHYRRFYQALASDVEDFLKQWKERANLSDQEADKYRKLSRLNEDEFVEYWENQMQRDSLQDLPMFRNNSWYNQPGQPVVGINWYEAVAYTTWLSRITGREYRLPTEAEWEWAARRNKRSYPWGNEWDASRCNWRGSRLNRPNPVGIFLNGATDIGLQEMAGNVIEWTSSQFRPYPYAPSDGREDYGGNKQRVVRGGSWATDKDRVRCAFRLGLSPVDSDNHRGFRIAVTGPQEGNPTSQ